MSPTPHKIIQPSAEQIDRHLDNVLTHAGSGLRHYTMHRSLELMRNAMRDALIEAARAQAAGPELQQFDAALAGMTHHITDEQIFAVADEHADGGHGPVGEPANWYGFEQKSLLEFARAVLAIAAPAPQGEPVAWLVSLPDEPELGEWFSEQDMSEQGYTSKPLHTAPAPAVPSDELAEFERAYNRLFRGRGVDTRHISDCEAVWMARAALTAAPTPPAQSEPKADWREPHPPSRQCMCPSCIPSFDDRFAQPAVPESADGNEEAQAPTIDIKAAAGRLMGWPLPKDFSPDNGIRFTPPAFGWPTGTNLLNVTQAEQMLTYALGTTATAVPESADSVAPVQLGELAKRNVYDAIRGAYDLGYNDARNARAVPGDSAPDYEGRSVEADHGGALINSLNRRLRSATAIDAARKAGGAV